MKKEAFDDLKKEVGYIGLLFLLALAIFKIAFFKESLIVLIRNVWSLFWLFVLPGYFMMFYWHAKIRLLERLIAGIFLSASIVGISSYYLGLIGFDIKYHAIILPTLLIIGAILINFNYLKN